MAAIWMSQNDLMDHVAEEVAIRSGILLADSDCRRLLRGTPLTSAASLFRRSENGVRVRPEFVSDLVRVLRAAIGNLPDAEPAIAIEVRLMKEIADSKVDADRMIVAISEVLQTWDPSVALGADFVDAVVSRCSAPGWAVENFLLTRWAHQEREVDFFRRKKVDWDGVTPLGRIFKAEVAPPQTDAYLDQAFLDYLAANEGDIHRLHWRNFERLCAEFFRRNNCIVNLGRGSKDGGVDIRVWSKDTAEAPLLLIQCKRLAKNNAVDVETVKAFWADVAFEEAQRGLIATTTRVSADGKRVCSARGYHLEFAEHARVVAWTRSMWRHRWKAGADRFRGVGRYLLPPIRIFSASNKAQRRKKRP